MQSEILYRFEYSVVKKFTAPLDDPAKNQRTEKTEMT